MSQDGDIKTPEAPKEQPTHFNINTWQPEPLVPETIPQQDKPHIVSSKPGKMIVVDGISCLNFATHNYLGLAEHPELENASISALRRYGVGSCGPRAFFGTMDIHVQLEKELACFLGLEEVALYSFGFATMASAIPAYAKSTDVIFFDEQCNFAIQQGITAAKCKAIPFKHNDPEDLERCISNEKTDVRRFIIVEGIYLKTGRLCPLKQILDIKKRHKIRLYIDESRSFGVLGSEGRGITQHFGIEPNQIDLIMSSLDNALCAYGGFSAGSSFVVDHQRLSGSGYCFSASLSPLQTQVALSSLDIIRRNSALIQESQKTFQYAQESFNKLTNLKNISDPESPIKVLILKSTSNTRNSVQSYNQEDELKLKKICSDVLEHEKIAIAPSNYLVEKEMVCPIPSIRVAINGAMDHSDIDRARRAIERYSCSS